MVFSSISFLFFILPLFLVGDFLAGRLCNSVFCRNLLLLVISLLFYTWGEVANVSLLITLGLVNYLGGRWVANASRKRLAVGGMIVLNLAVLFFFKYAVWLFSFFYHPIAKINFGLPLGISFFTFHAISYLIDIYRKEMPPAPNCLAFMTYFCMFPHLVAGPIVRYGQVRTELSCRALDNKELFSFGMYRFLLGFNKKIIIANTVAPLADAAFHFNSSIGFGDAWLGIIAYALQIYFDFSAYSDMAIGLAALAGFRFEENFRRPYSATSIRNFWRRWHISLSKWLRDYLYIPLGGSRGREFRTIINLLIVFFLCGLWHGANLTFVVWGLWHGFFLVLERIALGSLLERLPVIINRFYVILVVLVGWVFFRARDMAQAFDYLLIMFRPEATPLVLTIFSKSLVALVVGVCLCLIPDRVLPKLDSHNPGIVGTSHFLLQALMFFPALAFLISRSNNPFIYFNF